MNWLLRNLENCKFMLGMDSNYFYPMLISPLLGMGINYLKGMKERRERKIFELHCKSESDNFYIFVMLVEILVIVLSLFVVYLFCEIIMSISFWGGGRLGDEWKGIISAIVSFGITMKAIQMKFCDFPAASVKEFMKPEDMIKGLAYAFSNFYQPVFIHSDDSEKWLEDLLHSEQYGEMLSKELRRHIVRHIKKYESGAEGKNILYVFDDGNKIPTKDLQCPAILSIDATNLECLAERVRQILPFVSRININLVHVDYSFDLKEYEKQLQLIGDILFEYFKKGICKEIRQLTDRIFSEKMNNCFAGEKNITLAPDGKFYFCPAFYFDGSLDIDFEKSQKLTMLSKSPGCDCCDAYQCNRCIYKNYVGTGELNTPTKIQCTIAHLERKCSAELLKRIQEQNIFNHKYYNIPPLEYDDPLEQFNKKRIDNGITWNS